MLPWSPGLDRARTRQGLVHWCDATMPGWRPAAVRHLRGGLDTAMHAEDLLGPTGARRRVVLKRFDPRHTARGVEVACRRTWHALTTVERLDLPAPRPLWYDATGRTFGAAALVVTWVPARLD